ncbi:P-type conjugative transfer protein TrbL [Bordetella trematum]|jgi:type IV secretion system protein TrbL|uniref:P-type conjugative transfer protein TrbL n=1 Tax=Thioalkalivibrio sulfidiphilus (strain HL-EbGR7) TaxID=396588 RepID=B8GSW7_THISH|nr:MULTISPECIES: P-type conjugative transfer protein TrbL [Pseudomonadota]HBO1126295.1 P-type conjugative transfer protein TrbL [Pseudomonas aeruginosa]ACL72982.1 P-type conjugative transfer protein TrbL [Thioalkalivibrio sulfidiphilus HL-EbGr7]AUL48061.1 P-type conjugative transfer protein TrbL [Bordetella trematum]KRG83069.1 conjugal transfer protein TrbL [Stenotrophomonas acidaminiphila]QOF99819.1 P-type conjugative transfer protein TrbL [Stenotrophomonas sp. CW117]
MNDVTIIDQFLNTFAAYIDSGFGLLRGEVAFLTATLIVIDMTIAGLYWAMSHATGQGEDVIAKLLRKVLYVGAFAYIIGNFNWLASIVFRSFAGLGITATGSAITMENFLQPGRLAKTGLDAGGPIFLQLDDMMGFPEVFLNLDAILVLFLAWLVVVLCFFVLAIQLFITLIEFKLTTLAGFVLVPFALWNKTSFLAEKVLGNVVASGVKVLVLAVIVGIGSGLFTQFQVHPDEPSLDHALVIMLASLTLLALGIFGPGIATGLVSGAPQLGAGAMAGAAIGAAGTAVAVGAAATGVGSAVAAGARMAPAAAKLAGSGARAATSAAGSAKSAFQAGSAAAGGGAKGAMAGLGNVAKTGAQAAGRGAASRASAVGQRMAAPFRAGWNGAAADSGAGAASGQGVGEATPSASNAQTQEQPAWAKRLHRRQQLTHAATTTAHALRGGDGGGSGQGPSLRDSDS